MILHTCETSVFSSSNRCTIDSTPRHAKIQSFTELRGITVLQNWYCGVRALKLEPFLTSSGLLQNARPGNKAVDMISVVRLLSLGRRREGEHGKAMLDWIRTAELESKAYVMLHGVDCDGKHLGEVGGRKAFTAQSLFAQSRRGHQEAWGSRSWRIRFERDCVPKGCVQGSRVRRGLRTGKNK